MSGCEFSEKKTFGEACGRDRAGPLLKKASDHVASSCPPEDIALRSGKILDIRRVTNNLKWQFNLLQFDIGAVYCSAI